MGKLKIARNTKTQSINSSFFHLLSRNQPTKSDWDAYIALKDTVINDVLYPNILKWKLAMDQFSAKTKRDEFTSPTSLKSFNRTPLAFK